MGRGGGGGGLKPQPPDHQSDAHPTEPPRPTQVCGTLIHVFSYFSMKTCMPLML